MKKFCFHTLYFVSPTPYQRGIKPSEIKNMYRRIWENWNLYKSFLQIVLNNPKTDKWQFQENASQIIAKTPQVNNEYNKGSVIEAEWMLSDVANLFNYPSSTDLKSICSVSSNELNVYKLYKENNVRSTQRFFEFSTKTNFIT